MVQVQWIGGRLGRLLAFCTHPYLHTIFERQDRPVVPGMHSLRRLCTYFFLFLYPVGHEQFVTRERRQGRQAYEILQGYGSGHLTF